MGKISEEHDLSVNQRKFLEAHSVIGTISGAARAVGISHKTHYKWMASDEYQVAFRESRVRAADEILESCREVAIRDRNTSMLIHLSRGYFPEMFGTNRHEFSGPAGGPIEMTTKKTTDQLLERLRDLQQRTTSCTSSEIDSIHGLPGDGVADPEGCDIEHRSEAVDP
tara:strand:- start:205 stop:708 length:504 start_codon:yes stop_codon:yes gene_type:complete